MFLYYFFTAVWPMILLLTSLALLLAAVLSRKTALYIPACSIMAIGGILHVQNLTQNWESWVYSWPVIFIGIGAGFILFCTDKINKRLAWLGRTWVGLGLVFFALCTSLFHLNPHWFHWTMILVGSGLLFIIPGLNNVFRKHLIPGMILTGLGLLLSYQWISADWHSWTYVWPLIPGLTGLGLILSAERNLTLFRAGQIIVWISTICYLTFAVAFANAWHIYRYWPMLLIIMGVVQLTSNNGQINRRLPFAFLAKKEALK